MNQKSYLRNFNALMNKDCTPNQLSDLGEFDLVQQHVLDRDAFTEKGARKTYEKYYLPFLEELPQGIISADVSLEEKGVAAMIYCVGCSSSNVWAWREPDWGLYFKAPFISPEDEKKEEIADEEAIGVGDN